MESIICSYGVKFILLFLYKLNFCHFDGFWLSLLNYLLKFIIKDYWILFYIE
jgi:hypothetical protein